MQGVLPDWTAPFVALLTQLGDVWFLVVLLVAVYVRRADRREEVVLVGGLFLASIGLVQTLKYTLQFPRPDRPLLAPELVPSLVRPLYEVTAFSGGYGFPSGHATGTAVVYVGLAAVLAVEARRRWFVAAGSLVALVSLTRIALGLHFLVDVLAGAVLGSVLAVGGVYGLGAVTDDPQTVALSGALATNGASVLASGGESLTVLAVLVTAALLGGWWVFGRPTTATHR